MSIEIISAFIGLILTLMVFSYLIGDNPLFRIAVYLFIGVASGYAAAVIVYYVLISKVGSLQTNDITQLVFTTIIPLLLGATLFAKLSPRMSWIGNIAMAVLVGVGTAVAIGGALMGTLMPQVGAAINAFDVSSAGGGLAAISKLGQGVVVLAGTVLTLASFHFSAGRAADGTPQRIPILEGVAWLGRIFVAITLGVLFAGVYVSALTAMIERWSFVINSIRQWVGI